MKPYSTKVIGFTAAQMAWDVYKRAMLSRGPLFLKCSSVFNNTKQTKITVYLNFVLSVLPPDIFSAIITFHYKSIRTTMESKAKQTQDCLAELANQFKLELSSIVARTCFSNAPSRDTASPADSIIIIGRTGSGKSSLLEDFTGLHGYSQHSIDSGKHIQF
jgi:ABC-type uncharacterized transport system fused permease/ATPase subunit